MNFSILSGLIGISLFFLLPVAILSIILAYFTKEPFDSKKTGWRRRFKLASIVAKASSTLIIIYSLYLLSSGGFDQFAFVINIIPFILLLILVWGAAFLISLIITKENKYLFVSINLLIFILVFNVAYILTLPAVNLLNAWQEKQVISSIQTTNVGEVSLPPMAIKTDTNITQNWRKLQVGSVTLFMPDNWSVAGDSTLNHKLVDFIRMKEFFTSDSKLRFIIRDYVKADKVLAGDDDINKRIVSFIANEYKLDPKRLQWGYLQKDGINIGIRVDNPFTSSAEKIPLLAAFYANGDLFIFYIKESSPEPTEQAISDLVNNIFPAILGTFSS